jgi:hypothetical protein
MQSPHAVLIARTGQDETEPDLLQTRTIEEILQQDFNRSSHLPRDSSEIAPIPTGGCTAGTIIAGAHSSLYSNSSPNFNHSKLKQTQCKHAQSRRIVSETERMAASSSRPITVEERLKQLDDKLEKLKNMLQFQLDFIENLDSEAGRRMEQLEQDLSFVKIGFAKELDKLQQELQNPQERFADRIGELEDKLSKMNLEWGDSSEK